jgi:hypothetical protein
MIFKAVEMEKAGQIKGPLHVQIFMGVKNAMPVDGVEKGKKECRVEIELGSGFAR